MAQTRGWQYEFSPGRFNQSKRIEHSGAHDALADVTATISLAKLLREKQPKLFDYALALRCKKRLSKLIQVNDPDPLLFISGIFGAKRKNSGLVCLY